MQKHIILTKITEIFKYYDINYQNHSNQSSQIQINIDFRQT